MKLKWDRWVGNMVEGSDATPIFFIKHLVRLFGRRIDLHKFIEADLPQCFHTHPGNAIRVVLWGGYVEELPDGSKIEWKPGMIGLVRPAYSHRIDSLRNGRCSYSLWFRGRDTHIVFLEGSGWGDREGPVL